MKRTFKRMLKANSSHSILAWLGASYARLVLRTARMESQLSPASMSYFNGEAPAIFALWHSRIILIQSHDPHHLCKGGRTMRALVSTHSDGRMIGRIFEHFNISSIHGSTARGGIPALRALVREYKAGCNLAITPDGPKGPARVASEGIAQLALLTGAPVICVSYSCARNRQLKSWDKFMVPLPFSRIYYLSSDPILPNATAGMNSLEKREDLRSRIESELNRITDVADNLAGVQLG